MRCREFERSLEALLDGTLGRDDRAACAVHAADCPSCRELLAPMDDALDPVSGEPPPSFLGAVLAATSGPACATASSWLCEFVDGELDAAEHWLAQAHLAECVGCRSEAEALRNLAGELPSLMEIAPDPAFLSDAIFASAPPVMIATDVVAETWRRWMLRPRFAVEVAYVGVTLSCLVVLAEVSPPPGLLREASRARAVVASLRSGAGILLDRASSLVEVAKAPASAAAVVPSNHPEEQP